jgi:hypothetical protein
LDGSGNTSFPGTVTAPTFSGALSGNAATVTNGVYTTGDQTIGGTKTFSSTIVGSITGSAGSAGSAGTAGRLSTRDLRIIAPNSENAAELRFGFTSWANNNTGPYADYLHLRSYSDGSGGADNLVMFLKSGIGMRIYQQTFGSGTAYSSFKDVAWTDGTNASGSWGINITGTAASETLATVTGRGASTSTAISINNTLTVTSGRVIARTGGVNTYGIFSGYDNNNHLVSFRANITGPTSSPTITAGHQTNFIEYAEANDTTGWFFKSSSSTNYEDVVRITRIGITPGSNGTQNLGSSSARWNTVFTSDLSMSNGIGDYTIVEGEEDLFIYNNKTNKVFKFLLQEVDPSIAPAKKVH